MPPGDPEPPYKLPGIFVSLTIDDANQVRGLTTAGHAIAPVPLIDGTFILPTSVIDDPNHAARSEFLKTLPTVQGIMSDEIATGELYPDEYRACQYSSSWEAGELVVVEAPPGWGGP